MMPVSQIKGAEGAEPLRTEAAPFDHHLYMADDDRLDLVDAVLDRTVDLVSELYDNPHLRNCGDGSFEINKHGVVFCATCTATIGSIVDDHDETHCRRCDHPKHIHTYDAGRCLMCGNVCGVRAITT